MISEGRRISEIGSSYSASRPELYSASRPELYSASRLMWYQTDVIDLVREQRSPGVTLELAQDFARGLRPYRRGGVLYRAQWRRAASP